MSSYMKRLSINPLLFNTISQSRYRRKLILQFLSFLEVQQDSDLSGLLNIGLNFSFSGKLNQLLFHLSPDDKILVTSVFLLWSPFLYSLPL